MCIAERKTKRALAELTGKSALTVCAFFVMYPTLFPAFQEFVSLTGLVSVRMHPPVSPLCVCARMRCCTITPSTLHRRQVETAWQPFFRTNQPDSRGPVSRAARLRLLHINVRLARIVSGCEVILTHLSLGASSLPGRGEPVFCVRKKAAVRSPLWSCRLEPPYTGWRFEQLSTPKGGGKKKSCGHTPAC